MLFKLWYSLAHGHSAKQIAYIRTGIHILAFNNTCKAVFIRYSINIKFWSINDCCRMYPWSVPVIYFCCNVIILRLNDNVKSLRIKVAFNSILPPIVGNFKHISKYPDFGGYASCGEFLFYHLFQLYYIFIVGYPVKFKIFYLFFKLSDHFNKSI